MKKIFLIMLGITLAAGMVFGGCAQTAAPAQKTVKIGIMGNFGDANMLDMMHGAELVAELDNKNGGLLIGGEHYTIQLIEYDGKKDQSTEVAAINRLVFEDKVKYVIGTVSYYSDAWIPITNNNQVIAFLEALNPKQLSTDYQYNFRANAQVGLWAAMIGSFCKSNPEKVKNVVRAWEDSQMGHFAAQLTTASWTVNGVKPTDLFYPASQQDLSALGTKVVSLNPTLFTTLTGSDAKDGIIFNAIHQSGFRGQLFNLSYNSAAALSQYIAADALEGMVSGAQPFEFDPPLTQLSKDIKTAWTAKYNKWENPNLGLLNDYYCLRAGLQKAGTLDSDKVAAAIASGLKFETPAGTLQMISRPDIGQDRTVDSVSNYYMKIIHNGKSELMRTISLDEAIGYYNAANPPLPPGAAPGGPPPGAAPGGAPPGGGPPP